MLVDPSTAAADRAFVLQLLEKGPGVTLDELMARPAWHADAACRERPTAMFFPEAGEQSDEALAVCSSCLVAGECRAWALEQGPELAGVWGGHVAEGPGPSSARAHGQRRPPDPLETGTCVVCGHAGDDLHWTPGGLLDGPCWHGWKKHRRPTGEGFETWAGERRAFLALADAGSISLPA